MRTDHAPDSPPEGFPTNAEPADNSVGGLALDEREVGEPEPIQVSDWALKAHPELADEHEEPEARSKTSKQKQTSKS
jgi:hypothetical protein